MKKPFILTIAIVAICAMTFLAVEEVGLQARRCREAGLTSQNANYAKGKVTRPPRPVAAINYQPTIKRRPTWQPTSRAFEGEHRRKNQKADEKADPKAIPEADTAKDAKSTKKKLPPVKHELEGFDIIPRGPTLAAVHLPGRSVSARIARYVWKLQLQLQIGIVEYGNVGVV